MCGKRNHGWVQHQALQQERGLGRDGIAWLSPLAFDNFVEYKATMASHSIAWGPLTTRWPSVALASGVAYFAAQLFL